MQKKSLPTRSRSLIADLDASTIFDDDLTQINGKRDQLEGKIQERYGYAKDQARTEVDDWFKRMP